jgi:hypothetical protein
LSLKEVNFLWSFLAKGLSERKIELDEVIEPEQDEQSSAAPKNVLEAVTAFMARNQVERFEDKILLDNSNRQYTKKQ